MSNCVSLSHFDVVDKADKTGLPKMVVGAVFGVWQKENNNYDRFPNDSEFNAILNRGTKTSTQKVIEQPINKEIKPNEVKKITTAEISDLIKQGEIVYLDENKKPCKNWTK